VSDMCRTVELVPVDSTDGQVDEAEELEEFLSSLNISGKDKAGYTYAYDRTSDYTLSPDSLPQKGVPTGQLYRFRWTGHTVYPGVERNVWLYLPHGVASHDKVNLLVCQDGPWYFGPLVNATTVLDNLIHRSEIPMTAGLFVGPGEVGPGYPIFGGSDNRSIEYDSVNGDYARFLVDELFPVVRQHVDLIDQPAGRVICGMSSGGACALTAAFHRPDQFGNVVAHCGSFVNVRGAHQLPTMVRQTPRKPIRVWHQTGSRDADVIFGNLPIANHDLAASLRYRRYDTRFEFGNGGHSLRHGGAVFPETLRWIFRDQVEDR
jgi:enterochelin esterase-like enzyme